MNIGTETPFSLDNINPHHRGIKSILGTATIAPIMPNPVAALSPIELPNQNNKKKKIVEMRLVMKICFAVIRNGYFEYCLLIDLSLIHI